MTTARLKLRCIQPGDADATSASMTEAVSRWVISWPVPFTVAMAAERIEQFRASLADGSTLPFAIQRLSDQAFLGCVSITRTGAQGGLLSYWLGEPHQGQAYMQEALAAAIPAAFRLLELDVISAEAKVENARSLAILRGLGFEDFAEEMVFAPARGQAERCVGLALRRPVS